MTFDQNKCAWLRRFVVALPVLTLALGGCSDDSTTDVGDGNDPPGGKGGPLYAIYNILFAPDFSSRTDSVKFADALTADGKVDDSKTIEITSASSQAWPSYQLGEFFVSDSGTGQVIKYKVKEDGSIEESAKLSFAAYGVNAFHFNGFKVVSSTKAFLFDEITLQGFIWNPSDMTITSNVDLSASFRTEEAGKNYVVWPNRVPLQVGDAGKFASPFQYFDPPTFSMLPRSGMLVMDAESDTFSVVEHPTCGGLFSSVIGPDGMIYSATSIAAAAAHRVGVAGTTAPCMVRFDTEKMAFDDSYKIDLNSLVGGKEAGGLMAHPGGPVYVRALNQDMIPAAVPKDSSQATSSAVAWETYVLDDLTNPTVATKVDTPAAGGGIVYPVTIDDHSYAGDFDAAHAQSWFVDVSVNPPARGIEMEGWGTFPVRIR